MIRGSEGQRLSGSAVQRGGASAALRRIALVFFGCLGLLFLTAAGYAKSAGARGQAKDALRIVVSGEARVSGNRILLGQVATISGGGAALRRSLAGIDIGPAPRPGEQRTISGDMISVALADSGELPSDVRPQIPDRILVSAASQSLSEATLTKIFEKYVKRLAGSDQVVVSSVRVRGAKPLPPGKISLTPAGNELQQPKGRTSLRLAVAVDGESQGVVTVSGWVDNYARVVCAARQIARGTVLSEKDLRLDRVNLSKAPDRLVFNQKLVLGKRARTTIQTGQFIQQFQLETVPLVERGDMVRLLAIRGPIQVSSLGIAKADGCAGDQIRVENVTSKKTVIGRVVNASTVEVLF